MRKRKIILLGNVASMMLNFREHLIKDLINQDCIVYCLAKNYSTEDKQTISDWGAIAIESPLNSKGINPIKDLIAIVTLIRIFNSIKPDVVFSYFVKPVIFGTVAAKLSRIPRIVGMIEGLGNTFVKHKEKSRNKTKVIKQVQILLYKMALPHLDCLILLNKDDKKDLIDKYRIKINRLEILGGIGLDLQRFAYCPVDTNESISFIFIARLLKEKGIFEFLKAAEKIKSHYPDTKFYVLGGFDTENPFALKQSEFETYLQKGIVIYPGHVNNVPEWISKSSVFVLPSYYREGLPRSTQEAMAIGRPIITTDSVGCRETVDDGINGFLVPPFSVESLIEKMEFFINNPNKINEMGKMSRKIAEEEYNVHIINKRLLTILFKNN